MQRYILAVMCGLFSFMHMQADQVLSNRTIDVHNNTMQLPLEPTYNAIELQNIATQEITFKIESSVGHVIPNVTATESALTGTPGHIMYKNYIGYAITKPSTPGMPGSGKRLDYCAGACQRREHS